MKQKIYILLLLICVLPFSEEAGAQEVTLTIANPAHPLGIPKGDG